MSDIRNPGSRGPYAKSTKTRRRIIDAAIAVFGESGFAGGTTAAIAERAGVSEAQLYYHYASKRDLLRGVLEERDRIADEVSGPLPDDPADTPGMILSIAVSNDTMPEVVGLYMTMFAEAASPVHPAHESFLERYRRLRALFLTGFGRMEERGMLAPGVGAAYAAESTLALWDGIQLQWLLEPDAVDVVAALRRHLEVITRTEV